MLQSVKQIIDRPIRTTDGMIGKSVDAYFDDYFWVLRYLVLDTGTWLSRQRILLPPAVLGRPDWTAEYIPVALTKNQMAERLGLENNGQFSPKKRKHTPHSHVSPPQETDSALLPGPRPPGLDLKGKSVLDKPGASQPETQDEPHLRSAKEIMGYNVQTMDSAVPGFLDDLIIDDSNWEIPYLVVDARDWLAKKEVLVTPQHICSISWKEHVVHLNLWQDSVKKCPTYHGSPITHDLQKEMVDKSGLPKF